jgi:cobalt-precorrin-5B (C1)-methyltransferase
MQEETAEKKQKLRSGFTTGACATATSLAAANLLLTGQKASNSSISLPKGQIIDFKLEHCEKISDSRATASTIKDAGDDPDATHLATVFAEVELSPEAGVRFHAAPGVGTVTKAGLSIGVGEPAINPIPRQMMTDHLTSLADDNGYAGGFEVSIGVVDGEKIALRTMNGRLGILGGLSILGTTGIVRPYSCAAYIASIHQSIDVAHANGLFEIAASTGSTSEAYIKTRLGLTESALVEMGDFVGAVFKHLRKVPMQKLSICGGFGKMTKLAAGHSSLHSHDSSIDFNYLANLAEQLGANNELIDTIKHCNTSLEALMHCQQHQIPLADRISQLARCHSLEASHNTVEIDVYCVNKAGELVGSSLGDSQSGGL